MLTPALTAWILPEQMLVILEKREDIDLRQSKNKCYALRLCGCCAQFKMETLKQDLANWTEVEDVIIIIGKRLGIYEQDLKHNEIPKFVLWSESEDSKEVQFISKTLFNLVDLGAIERRDDQDDMEFRWNPKFKVKWDKIKTEPNM